MENENAKALFHYYQRQYNALVNTYVQARERHPFLGLPALTKAIWRAGILVDCWYSIAVKLEKKQSWGG